MKYQKISIPALLLMAVGSVGSAEPVPGQLRPLQPPHVKPFKPSDGLRPFPVPVKQKIQSTQGVLLVEDRVSQSQYVTTLDSAGAALAGSPPQAIYGGSGARAGRPVAWYTHKADGKVVRVDELKPAEAFRGVAAEAGNSIAVLGVPADDDRAVNPVFSDRALQELARMPMGGQQKLVMHETLKAGEREFHATVFKRGQLILEAAGGRACRNETLDGVPGKLCVLRRVSGQHQAISAGDVRFSVRGKGAVQHGRFRVGRDWKPMGSDVSVAEFAGAKTIEVFFAAPENKMAGAPQPLDALLEAKFYSASRQIRGDRFALRLGGALRPEVQRALSRFDLQLIDDQPSGRQYVTTQANAQGQSLYGELRGRGGYQPIWYVNRQSRPDYHPVQQVDKLRPEGFFNGLANADGRLGAGKDGGFINPVFSEQGFAALAAMPLGQQQQLSMEGTRSNGDKVQYRAHVAKAGQLRLMAGGQCRAEQVDGAAGQVCVLRRVAGKPMAGSGLRFRLSAKLPYLLQQKARYKVGQTWRRLNEPVELAEFGRGQALELFVPQDEQAKAQVYAVQGEFYSPMRVGDRFSLAFSTRLSPAAETRQKLDLIFIEDKSAGTEYVTTLNPASDVLLEGSRSSGARMEPARLWLKPGLQVKSINKIEPANWFPQTKDPAPARQGLELASTGFDALKGGLGRLGAELRLDLTLRQGERLIKKVALQNAGVLSFQSRADGECKAARVGDENGMVCGIGIVSGNVLKTSSVGRVSAWIPEGQKLRVGHNGEWHKAKETIRLEALATGGEVDIFVPDSQAGKKAYGPDDYRLVFHSGLGGDAAVYSIRMGRGDNSRKLRFACSGSTNYAPHIGQNHGYYKPPEVLDLTGLGVGQEKVIHTFAGGSSGLEFWDSKDGRTYSCQNDQYAIVQTKPFPASGDGTIPSGNADFVFTFYFKGNFLSANGGVFLRKPWPTMVWYMPSFELRVKRIGSTGDSSKLKYPQIIPQVSPTDTPGRSWLFEGPDAAQEFERGGFYTDVEGAPPFPQIPAKVLSVTARPSTVTAGETTTVTVQLDRPALLNQSIYVKFDGKSSADINDLDNPGMLSLSGASNPVSNLATGGVVAMLENEDSFTFDIATKADDEQIVETFDIRAKEGTSDDLGAPAAKVEILPKVVPPVVTSITVIDPVGGEVLAGNKAQFKVQLDKAALAGGQDVWVNFKPDSATIYDLTDRALHDLSSSASGSIADLTDLGSYVTVKEGFDSFTFTVQTAQDADTSREEFLMLANAGRMINPPAMKEARVAILPNAPAQVRQITASPDPVTAGAEVKLDVYLDKPALSGGQDVYLKLYAGTAGAGNLTIPNAYDLQGATGTVDIVAGGVVRVASTDHFSFKLLTKDIGDVELKYFDIRAKADSPTDASSISGRVNIAPVLQPEISFSYEAGRQSGEFGQGKPDVALKYGVKLSNYAPVAKKESGQYLASRLVRAAQVKVKVSDIDSHVVDSHTYCAFKTVSNSRKVAVPFKLQELGVGTPQEINCASLSELSLSDPAGWTPDGPNAYTTDIQATVVMSDPVSEYASGQPWSGDAKMNGKLTLDLQLK
nr:hypothetical protein [Chromobacterium sp. ASV5]